MKTIPQAMAGLKTVELNADSEYARSFGIEKGDLLFLDGFRHAEHGDLFIVLIDGKHQLDTYDDAYTVLDENAVGILAGCLKSFRNRDLVDADDDILDAEVIGDD